ncbi:MAG: MoaD/ThiS family protein [Nanoarchaeota archaeon]
MKVYIERTNENKNCTAKTVEDLLKTLEINPDTVLVSKNNQIVLPDEKLSDTDEVKILSVVSGG